MNKKIEFLTHYEDKWNDLESLAISTVRKFREVRKPFDITIKNRSRSKTMTQLGGIYRILELYRLRLVESSGFRNLTTDSAKYKMKKEFDIMRPMNDDEAFVETCKHRDELKLFGDDLTLTQFKAYVGGLKTSLMVPKSFADLTKEDAGRLLEGIHDKWVIGNGWSEMQLEPYEIDNINKYVN